VGFRRALGPFDATMVVIGGIIGSGIFINPYIVAQRLDTSAIVLAAWAAGGLIALAGAVVLSVVGADPSSAWRGAVLLAAGIPVFYWFTRRG
jgi:basic amino acid/polyamine antiporter, APA family